MSDTKAIYEDSPAGTSSASGSNIASSSQQCPNEQMALQKIKQSVLGIENFPDGRILRWLHEYGGDANRACEAIALHAIFRKAWRLDALTVEPWDGPSMLQEYCTYGFCGPDRQGSPILISTFGSQDPVGLMKSCQAQDYIRWSLYVIEIGLKKCEDLAKETGKPYEQMILVLDLKYMTTDHYCYKSFSASFLNLISIFQEHYPQLVKKILVINSPTIARMAYQAVQPFLSRATQTLVEMPGTNAWLAVVENHVDLANWPRVMGGDLIDHPECEQLTGKYKKVPESYFCDNVERDFHEHITIHAGHKQVIEIDVYVPDSKICWTYATIDEDVGFTIYYDPRGTAHDDTGRMSVVYPYIRLESSQVPVTGYYTTPMAGRYVVEFDNSYSWFSAKEMKYTIEVFDPIPDLDEYDSD